MFSTFDCAVKGYRQKEDAWNAIISGFMTGGCLAARSTYFTSAALYIEFTSPATVLGGPRAAFGSAVACGILLGVFEGVGVLLNRTLSEGNRQVLPPCLSTDLYVLDYISLTSHCVL
jgi:import inner membrane translocase subunit TIM17